MFMGYMSLRIEIDTNFPGRFFVHKKSLLRLGKNETLFNRLQKRRKLSFCFFCVLLDTSANKLIILSLFRSVKSLEILNQIPAIFV